MDAIRICRVAAAKPTSRPSQVVIGLAGSLRCQPAEYSGAAAGLNALVIARKRPGYITVQVHRFRLFMIARCPVVRIH